MPEVTWRKYHSWSGCKISGGDKYAPDDDKDHMQRALWLTAQVEGGGTFGAINSYDGAAMSAGLEHKIAVYPKSMEQGSLWKLLRQLELYAPCQELENLWDSFKHGPFWYLAQDGTVRHYNTGRLITAREIRDELSPPGGKVPKTGQNWEKAKDWALLFHELFSAQKTHQVQVNSAIDSLVRGNGKNESEAYKVSVGVEHPTVLRAGENIDMEHDLAWCVYHSFSVNAPSMARRRLSSSRPDNSLQYPKRLIRVLGTTNYGRWHDTFDGGNRYDRTRIYAMRSKYWPEELFNGSNAIMPKNL
jgi:hypothetical protein